jgi:hypothetical protein
MLTLDHYQRLAGIGSSVLILIAFTLQIATLTAMAACGFLRIEKKAMIGAFHWEHALPDLLVA